jgi:enoyl-CoA hydratase/carnithine racemase
MSYEEILFQNDDNIATITLNRPATLNAWTRTMERELHHALMTVERDPEVRVIIITGSGKGFCAGGDKSLLEDLAKRPCDPALAIHRPPMRHDIRPDFQGRFSYLWGLSKPVIAAINGPAAGVGLVLALYCDWRFATPTAKLTAAFSKLGLAAEHGAAWLLPRLIGLPRATDLLLSSRTLSGADAQSIGLVHAVFDAETLSTEVSAFARHLATTISPRSMAMIKRQLHEGLFSTLSESIALAEKENETALQSQDFAEGLASIRERRPPRFTGR